MEKNILKGTSIDEHFERVVSSERFQDMLDCSLDDMEEEDIDNLKSSIAAMTDDFLHLLCENYCLKNGYDESMAEEMFSVFTKRMIEMEDDGCDDFEMLLEWVRDEIKEDEK